MPSGVVEWFDRDRGVGLIREEGEGLDVTAELSAVHGGGAWPLIPGEHVEFDLTQDAAGTWANNIHRIWWRDCR